MPITASAMTRMLSQPASFRAHGKGEATHDLRAACEHHHHSHDLKGEDPVDHRAPEEGLDWIDWRGVEEDDRNVIAYRNRHASTAFVRAPDTAETPP